MVLQPRPQFRGGVDGGQLDDEDQGEEDGMGHEQRPPEIWMIWIEVVWRYSTLQRQNA